MIENLRERQGPNFDPISTGFRSGFGPVSPDRHQRRTNAVIRYSAYRLAGVGDGGKPRRPPNRESDHAASRTVALIGERIQKKSRISIRTGLQNSSGKPGQARTSWGEDHEVDGWQLTRAARIVLYRKIGAPSAAGTHDIATDLKLGAFVKRARRSAASERSGT